MADPSGNPSSPFGDTDYRKSQSDLLRDLIEKANPGFKAKVPVGTYTLGAPAAIASPVGPLFNNTTIKITAGTGQTSVIGSRTINYRRISLDKLFNGRTVVIEKYTIANSLPFAEIAPMIAQQLGVNLDSADFNVNVALSPDSSYPFTMKATSLCYTGTIRVTWTKGKRDIAELFGTGELDGRVWPAGLIDIQDGSKPQGEMMFYDTDFTSQAAILNSFTSGAYDNGAWNTALDPTSLITYLKTLRPDIPWTRGDYRTLVGGLGYAPFKRYTIPNAAVPEANSGMYNRVMVIEPLALGDVRCWFFGRILLHYNA